MCDVNPNNNNNNNHNNNNSCNGNKNDGEGAPNTNTVVNSTGAKSSPADDVDVAAQLSASALNAYCAIAQLNGLLAYRVNAQPIAGIGENSYGAVLQVQLIPSTHTPPPPPLKPLHSILKMAPKNAARRAHMRVVDFYAREVFMYESVFREFRGVQADLLAEGVHVPRFEAVPQLLHASLAASDEFLIFEDLMQSGYAQNSRVKMPTHDLVASAFRAVAQLHAMSFVLQARRPQAFAAIVAQMDDNLFTPQMDAVSLEFGKKYVRRTRHMLEEEQRLGRRSATELSQRMLQTLEEHFKPICLEAVDGAICAPYAVICHGDFWNNNILYQYDSNAQAHTAKLIDFQMSRYAAPVLDLVHYLFACTEQELRDQHFYEFLQIYYDALAHHIRAHRLDPSAVYPEAIFRQQLRDYGFYGFCMSAFAIPFFIANTSEFPDLDEVSEAIQELSSSSDNSDAEDERRNATPTANEHGCADLTTAKTASSMDADKCRELVDEYDLLNERTVPIFKRRMLGIVADLIKYDMAEKVLQYA